MGWETRFQNNDPSYLEPRISNAESSLAEIATNLLSPGNNLSPCIGDGASDDSATLQAIINYASANGKAVLFPNGKTFVIKNDVNLSNVQLFCLNRGSSPNLILNGGALRITGDNVTIENLSVTLGTNHKKSWLNTDSTPVHRQM